MTRLLGITLRIGAAHDQIETDDGRIIDRSIMDRADRNKARRLVREAFISRNPQFKDN